MAEQLVFEVDRIYRAKKPRINALGEYSDRMIVHIGVFTVQYDSSTVKNGMKYPSISKEKFEKWAGSDVTEHYKDNVADGYWDNAYLNKKNKETEH